MGYTQMGSLGRPSKKGSPNPHGFVVLYLESWDFILNDLKTKGIMHMCREALIGKKSY